MRRVIPRKLFAYAIFAACGAASLSGVGIVSDARKVEPLVLATDEPAAAAAQEKAMGAPARYGSPVPVFIHLSEADPDVPRKVQNLGGRASAVLPRLYAGAMPRDAARYVSNWPSVAYIEAGKKARLLLDQSRPATGADVVQSGGSGLPASYNGTGAYVGIVDTGLSKNHRDFSYNGQLTLPRVAYWSPSQSVAGVDTEWHGTHVAGIAAGNGFSSGGLYTGMAPGALLLICQSTFLTTSIPTEIDGILAAAGGSPVAVNLSLGLMIGPHDGTSGFEQAVNSRATGTSGSKQIIAVAAGNERTDKEHFRTVLPPFGVVSVPVTVNPAASTVDIWADGADRYSVTASVLGGTASASSDQPPNGATHFQVFFSVGSTATATIQLKRTRNGGTGRVDAYIDSWDGAFGTPSETGTIIEPANGANVIAVASFNTRLGGNPNALGDISSFSSLGPTRDGRPKPDIAAPGSLIYSAKSLDAFNGGTPPANVPGNDNYAVMQGTSMATPHVAGIAALVWETNPSLTGAQMRARLKKTATLPGSITAPDNTWGNGKVNALQAASRTVAAITAPATAAPGATVALSSGDSSGAFNPLIYSYALSYAWTLAGKPAGSAAALASSAASTTFTPDIPGNYTVALTVSQSAPAGVPAGSDNAVIHVNTVPVAAIAGQGSTDNVAPVTFAGSATDPDVPAFGQTMAFHWVLVTRPTGSLATLSPVGGTNNATLAPDIKGNYEIGVRADDGLDNSALAVFSFWSGGAPASGGGGGCSVARTGATDNGAAAGTIIFLLLALAGTFLLRHRVNRAS